MAMEGDPLIIGPNAGGPAGPGPDLDPAPMPAAHYTDIPLAVDRTYWFTFFDDEGGRDWLRMCKFHAEEAQVG